jgi:hypothetical protein
MNIYRPQLPPRAGYVEIEDGDGIRQYQKIETEQDRQIAAPEAANAALQGQLKMLDGALSDFLVNIVPTLGTGA